ncbi:glycosyltransferase family 39 protein [Nodosilinea sp. P-1105]|uniref:glycosyltransferase family 39 protein n=1 Tax=Nodosilinea sp. P-1105 TaxID=2546229 RepID=UPI00146F0EF2|nr:glycosyltransferase family 39 protein [Nodosilinea sp. P-1105]NMF83043.1 hypothetical protein [Nodosilinea sp. P-1105]
MKLCSHTRNRGYLPVCLILIGFFLRFFLLTNQSLWWDEGFSIENSQADSLEAIFSQVRQISNADKFQPLYYWLLFLVRHFWGDSERILRGFSAFLSSISLPIIYLTAFRFYGRRHALWSLVLAVFSAFLVYYSQEVRNYSLLFLVSVAQIYFISTAIIGFSQGWPRHWRNQDRWIFASLTGIGLLCSVQMIVVTASLCLSHLLLNTKKIRLWFAWWWPAAISVLPAAFYYVTLPGEKNPAIVSISRATHSLLLNILYVPYGTLTGLTYGPSQNALRGGDYGQLLIDYLPHILVWLVIFSLLVWLSVNTCLQPEKTRKSRDIKKFLLCFLVFSNVLGFCLVLVTGMSWLPRHAFYVWVILPFWLPTLLCSSHTSVRQSQSLSSGNLSRLAIMGLLALNIYSLQNYYLNTEHWRDDYRGLTRHLAVAQVDGYKTVLLSGGSTVLRYYGDLDTAYLRGGWNRQNQPTWLTRLREAVNAAPQVVLAVYRPHQAMQASLNHELSKEYEVLSEVDSFHGFHIYHLRRR